MTDAEAAERKLLSLASEKGKFAIQIGAVISLVDADALERLQLRDWIRLIDVSPIANAPGMFRVFRVMPDALEWIRKTSN